jgi:large subunit ribosomal protein L21
MHAVIKTGGKQYRVKEGDVLKIEQLPADIGQIIDFNEILMITENEATTIGSPFVDKASVKAEVMAQGRHKKIKIIKFRRRKHHMKQMGHRQNYTEIKITAIAG